MGQPQDLVYQVNEATYKIRNCQYLVKIIDFGRSQFVVTTKDAKEEKICPLLYNHDGQFSQAFSNPNQQQLVENMIYSQFDSFLPFFDIITLCSKLFYFNNNKHLTKQPQYIQEMIRSFTLSTSSKHQFFINELFDVYDELCPTNKRYCDEKGVSPINYYKKLKTTFSQLNIKGTSIKSMEELIPFMSTIFFPQNKK